jgi:hypothetical protein
MSGDKKNRSEIEAIGKEASYLVTINFEVRHCACEGEQWEDVG